MLSNLRKFKSLAPYWVSRARFGGGHHDHHKEYDWREDPAVNKDLVQDVRDVGWHPENYSWPYQGHEQGWLFNHRPDNYNPNDLTVNYRPENKPCDVNYNAMRVSFE